MNEVSLPPAATGAANRGRGDQDQRPAVEEEAEGKLQNGTLEACLVKKL
jgi:hypothetical protein